MRHPMGDDAGFSASSPRENQQGALDMGDGLALAGIEAFKEIHGNTHFSMAKPPQASYKTG